MSTTIAKVKQIINTGLSDVDITALITTAETIRAAKLGTTSGLGDSTIELIDTYLTAHIIATTRERQTSEEKIGEVTMKFQGAYGEYLNATSYGQMILMLDTTGAFATVGKKKVQINVIQQFDE